MTPGSALRDSPDPAPRPIKPGGRWHRILRAVSTRPMRCGEILDATHVSDRPRKIENRKVWWAVTRMADVGLIAHTPAGFIATASGTHMLAMTPDPGPATGASGTCDGARP